MKQTNLAVNECKNEMLENVKMNDERMNGMNARKGTDVVENVSPFGNLKLTNLS